MRYDLKKRRRELGLTLEEVAKMCNVGKSTVRKWETGIIENMKIDKVELLAKALQITPYEIMGIKEPLIWDNLKAKDKMFVVDNNIPVYDKDGNKLDWTKWKDLSIEEQRAIYTFFEMVSKNHKKNK